MNFNIFCVFRKLTILWGGGGVLRFLDNFKVHLLIALLFLRGAGVFFNINCFGDHEAFGAGGYTNKMETIKNLNLTW